MEAYLIINALLSIAALIFIKFVRGGTPEKIKVLFLALLSWCVPYDLIANLNIIPHLIAPTSAINLETLSIINNAEVSALGKRIRLHEVFQTLIFIGALVACFRIYRENRFKRELLALPNSHKENEISQEYGVDIYICSSIKSAMLLGLFFPAIAISKDLVNSKHQGMILEHEKQHFLARDHWATFTLGILTSLFFWNPLVLILIREYRYQIEVRCDQRTAKKIGFHSYQNSLTELSLNQALSSEYIFSTSVLSKPKNTINRLKEMQMTQYQQSRKIVKLAFISFILLAGYSITAVTTAATVPVKTPNKSTISSGSGEIQHRTQGTKGALLDLNLNVEQKTDGQTTTQQINSKIWSHYNRPTTVQLGDNFALDLLIVPQGDTAMLELDLRDLKADTSQTIIQPKLLVVYDKEVGVKVGNDDNSKMYSLKITMHKSSDQYDFEGKLIKSTASIIID